MVMQRPSPSLHLFLSGTPTRSSRMRTPTPTEKRHGYTVFRSCVSCARLCLCTSARMAKT